jgi:hypothetical protein
MEEQGRKVGRRDPDVDRLAIGVNLGKQVCLQVVEYLRETAGSVERSRYMGCDPDVLDSRLPLPRRSRNRTLGGTADPTSSSSR